MSFFCNARKTTNFKGINVYKRINALGLVDRSVVLLWLEGLSYDEIGAILGIRHSLSIIHTTVPSAPPSYM